MKLNTSRFKSKLLSLYIGNLLICTLFSHYTVYASTPSEIGFYVLEIHHLLYIAGFCVSLCFSLTITSSFGRRVSKWLYSYLMIANSSWQKIPYILYSISLLACLAAYFLVIRHLDIDVLRSAGLIGLGFLSIWFGTPFVVSANALFIGSIHSRILNRRRLLSVMIPVLIAYLPSFAIGTRSVAVTGIISLFMILDVKSILVTPFISLFRSIRINVFTILAIAFVLVVSSLLGVETIRRGDNGNYIMSYFRVDGISAISVIGEHLPVDLEEISLRSSTLFREILFVPIPRFLNPHKPIPFTVQLVQDSFSHIFVNRGWELTGLEGGVSTTVIGEFLWAFGWPGPIIAGFLMGAYINILASLMVVLRHSILVSACAYLGAFVVMSAETFSVFMNASSILVAILAISAFVSFFIPLGNFGVSVVQRLR